MRDIFNKILFITGVIFLVKELIFKPTFEGEREREGQTKGGKEEQKEEGGKEERK